MRKTHTARLGRFDRLIGNWEGLISKDTILFLYLNKANTIDLYKRGDGDFVALEDFRIVLYESDLTDIKPIEPEIDWSKVPVDTPVLVTNCKDSGFYKRFLLGKNPNSRRYDCFEDGKDKWSSEGNSVSWAYCKLAPHVEVKEEWYK